MNRLAVFSPLPVRASLLSAVLLFLLTAPPALVAAASATDAPPSDNAASQKPNFILIFCDDLGYGDLGCFGSKKHKTPHIDRMAANGTMFTSFYSTSGVCTPSRSSLMTGCYPRRVNMHQSARNEWVLFPVAKKGLHPDEITVAEVLKKQGYKTACIGKWHLGDQKKFLPTRQGFDLYFGIPYSNDMGAKQRKQNPPLPLLRNETVIEAPVDQNTLTRRYTEEAVAFIRKNKGAPFFLYLPHAMPHNPVHASSKFQGSSENGGYGDAVQEIDWSTGQILQTLKELKLEKNTLVVFTSDNGAAKRWGGSNTPLSGWKGSCMEGGMRIPCVMHWPGIVPAGKQCNALATTMDILPTFAAFAGTTAPQDRKIDGKNIRALVAGKSADSPYDFFLYYFKDKIMALRSDNWKLHLPYNVEKNGNTTRVPARLYDLDLDIKEQKNVMISNISIATQLLHKLKEAVKDLGNGPTEGENQRSAGMVEDPAPLVKSSNNPEEKG